MQIRNTPDRLTTSPAEALAAQAAELLHGRSSADRAALHELGDQLVRELSAFGSMAELLSAADHGYRPTCRLDLDPGYEVLADLYDALQGRAGRRVRAVRYGACR